MQRAPAWPARDSLFLDKYCSLRMNRLAVSLPRRDAVSSPIKLHTLLGKSPVRYLPIKQQPPATSETGIRFLQGQKPRAQKHILKTPVHLPSRSSFPPLEGSVGLHTHKTNVLPPDTVPHKPMRSENQGEEKGWQGGNPPLIPLPHFPGEQPARWALPKWQRSILRWLHGTKLGTRAIQLETNASFQVA